MFAEARSLRDIVDVLTPADPESVPASAPAPELGFEPAPAPGANSIPEDGSSRAAIGRWHAGLVQLPPPDRLLGGYPEPAVALVVDDGGPFAAAITTALSREGWRVRLLRLPAVAARRGGVIEYQLDSWAPTELGTKIAKVLAERVHLVIDCLTAGSGCWEHGTRRLAHSLLLAKHLVHPLTEAAANGRAALLTVTNLDGAFGLTGVAADLAPAAGVTGLVKTLAIEAPAVFCRAVDVAPGMTPEAAAAAVLAEAHDPAAEPLQVGLDGQLRVTLGLADQPAHLVASSPDGPATLSSDDLLVVTGGGRGITAACVVELSRRHQPGLLLLGRTQLEDDPAWARGVADAALKAAAAGFLRDSVEKPTPRRVDRLVRAVAGAREIRTTLELLRKAGSNAEYLAVDVKDPAAVAEALFGYRDRITGLVHGAGVLADQMIEKKQAAEIERVFGPKLAGLRSMIAALPAKALRHLVLFSSVAGFFGNRGQADYAMANEVLNAFAASWKADHPDCRVTSINWGAWDSGMVTGELRTMFERRGIPLIPAGKGAELFAEQFTPDRAADLVTVLGPRVALSERPLPKLPGPVTVERSLDDYQSDPMIADHLIGGCPVLPAVVALGWIVGLVERVTGSPVSRVRDFVIHKGIVFDGSQPRQCRLVLTPGPDAVKVTIHSVDRSGTVRPHYAAVVESGPAPVPAAPTGLPPLGCGVEAGSRYRDGTLFHGPALRGLRRVLSEAETRLIVECQVPDPVAASSAATASCFLPVAADLLLQACLVWVRDCPGNRVASPGHRPGGVVGDAQPRRAVPRGCRARHRLERIGKPANRDGLPARWPGVDPDDRGARDTGSSSGTQVRLAARPVGKDPAVGTKVDALWRGSEEPVTLSCGLAVTGIGVHVGQLTTRDRFEKALFDGGVVGQPAPARVGAGDEATVGVAVEALRDAGLVGGEVAVVVVAATTTAPTAEDLATRCQLAGPARTVTARQAGVVTALVTANDLLAEPAVAGVLIVAVGAADVAGAVVVCRQGEPGRAGYVRLDAVGLRYPEAPGSGLVGTGGVASSLAEAARAAIAAAGIRAADVEYLDAVGGAGEGWPAEVAALAKVYPAGDTSVAWGGAATTRGPGAANPAELMIGLIRTVLCLRHGYLPGTAGWRGPEADLAEVLATSGLYVPDTSQALAAIQNPRPPARRRGCADPGGGARSARTVGGQRRQRWGRATSVAWRRGWSPSRPCRSQPSTRRACSPRSRSTATGSTAT